MHAGYANGEKGGAGINGFDIGDFAGGNQNYICDSGVNGGGGGSGVTGGKSVYGGGTTGGGGSSRFGAMEWQVPCLAVVAVAVKMARVVPLAPE